MKAYSFPNSIIENSEMALDAIEPLTFLAWYNQKKLVSVDISALFDDYRKYINSWSEAKKLNKQEQAKTIRDSYIQILRETIINFSTQEERRFILNADFSSETDLDIILPFFIQKIKNVCLFYVQEREKIKNTVQEFKLKGSNRGIKNTVNKIIFDAANSSNLQNSTTTYNFPPVSALAREINVYVEELYDTNDQYYNIAPNSITTFLDSDTLRQSLSSSNINSVNSVLYSNFREAIKEAIKEYPFFIASLGLNNFQINPILDGTELYYLKNRDFVDYLSGGESNLKLNLLKKLAPKYLANDFYYLSTGSTATNFVSGLLFSTKPLTGADTLNLLNRQYPSTATVPNLNTLYSDYIIGRFFLPQHMGILIYNAPSKTLKIDTDALEANKLYAFPDPEIIGNTSYNSGVDNKFAPFTYEIDVSWNKISRANQFAFGDVLSNGYNQQFYGYQSLDQDLNRDTAGISRTIDNVQFWTGDMQDRWANPDIWPGLTVNEQLPIDERQRTILANDLTPTLWCSDKYGNDYAVLKRVFNLNSLSSYNDGGIITGSETQPAPNNRFTELGLFKRKTKIPGTLYFRNNITSIVSPASSALSAVYFKYPTLVQQELNDSIIYFHLYNDTFVAETINYVVVDSLDFNYDNNKITANNNSSFYYTKDLTVNGKLETFIGEWYEETENQLYLVFLKLLPSLSATNFRALYPLIYKTPLTNVAPTVIYPDRNTNIFNIYSLSGISDSSEIPQINLHKISGAAFSKDTRKNVYNLTYLSKNLNDMPLFINEQLVSFANTFVSNTPVLFKPYYFIHDNNYSNSTVPNLVRYNASSSGNTGVHNTIESVLDAGQYDRSFVNYLFNDGVKALQINKLGYYVIQFDWESYNKTSLFIGCDQQNILNIDNNLIFNVGTSKVQVLRNNIESIQLNTIPVTASNGIAYNINTTVQRLTYPDASLMSVNITSDPPGYNELICNTPQSIFYSVDVVKGGNGSGIVFSDPFCIECGGTCSENLYSGSTLTVIASPDYYSKFIGWEGVNCEDSIRCDIVLTQNAALTAYFERLRFYNLTIGSLGYFNNYANSIPVGNLWCSDLALYCGDRCNADLLENTLLTLSCVLPISGWLFRGYKGGACEGYTDPTCTFFLTESQAICATYVRVYDYSLYVTVTGVDNNLNPIRLGSSYGNVISIPQKVYCPENTTVLATYSGTGYIDDENEVVTLSAFPKPGYVVRRLVGSSNCSIINPIETAVPCGGINNVCTFLMTNNQTVTAFFGQGYYTLNVILSGSGFGYALTDIGEINCSNYLPDQTTCCYQYLSGTMVTVSGFAFEGSSVRGIYSSNCAGEGVSACQFKMDSDQEVILRMDGGRFYNLIVQNTSDVGVVCSDPGGINCLSGTGDCIASYQAGTVVVLSAFNTNPRRPFITFFGEGILFDYEADPSLTLSLDGTVVTTINLSSFSPFTLGSFSGLTIASPNSGAPYLSGGIGTTITTDNVARILMTSNRTISARYN